MKVGHIGGTARRPLCGAPVVGGEDDDLEEESIPVFDQEPDATPLLAPGELHSTSGIVLLPLWDRWPAGELAKIRDRGLRAFQRSHGQRPIADDEAIFAASIDGCVDKSFSLGSLPVIPKARWAIVAGIDPASTGFWVLVVLAVERRSGHRFLLWIERVRGAEIDDHVAVIGRVYSRHRWTACYLERNNIQKLLLAQYRKSGAPIALSQTTAEKHFQLGMIADEMAAQKLHFPPGPRVQPLLDELKAHPCGRTRDCIEALRLAWLLADTTVPKRDRVRIDSVLI